MIIALFNFAIFKFSLEFLGVYFLVGFVDLFSSGALIWLSISVLLVLWLLAICPSSVGVLGGIYQVVGLNMMGKVVVSLLLRFLCPFNFKVECGKFI